MHRFRFGFVAAVAVLSAACGDDEVDAGSGGSGGAGPTTSSTGAGPSTTGAVTGSGGDAGTGGEAGTGGGDALDCSGTQTDDPRLAQALDLLRERLEPERASGGALAVIKDGAIIGLGAVGSKDSGACDPVTVDTLFNVGFQSQIVTRLAVLDAIEDGLLSLDTPITEVIPALEDQIEVGDPSDILVRHLLLNSSMLRSSSDRITDISTCGELVDAVGDDAIIQAPPGTMHDHDDRSNAELAGLALEVVDARPFAEAVRARVLDPLEMGGAYEAEELAASDHAAGLENGFHNDHHTECRNRQPSHGYNASISDVAKLLAYLGGGPGEVLGAASYDDRFGDHGIHFFSDSHANLLFHVWWNIPEMEDDVYVSGSYSAGFSEGLIHLRDRGLGVVVLMNSRESFPWLVASEVAAIYDETVSIQDPVYTLPEGAQADYVGTYVDAVGFDGTTESTLEISLDAGTTSGMSAVLHTSDDEMVPVAIETAWCEDNFIVALPGREGTVRFWRDEAGDVTAVQVIGDNGPPFFRVNEK
jgi:CubicO group peptidase (beta-lactamase class C family)